MARFYGEIQGGRGEATRTGTKQSGFRAHIRGWNVGCKVYLSVDKQGRDVVTVYQTGGSNGRTSDYLLATLTAGDDGTVMREDHHPVEPAKAS